MNDSFHIGDDEILRVMRVEQMTGLYNRVYFLERARDDVLRSRRYGWPMCIVLLSLDEFERIREEHGKVASDKLLAAIAAMIRKSARDTDIAARYDRAVYSLLLPGTSLDGGRVIAARLRNRVNNHVVVDDNGQTMKVTCTLAVAEYQKSIRDHDKLMQIVRTALRRAQELGGNRCVVASNSSTKKTSNP